MTDLFHFIRIDSFLHKLAPVTTKWKVDVNIFFVLSYKGALEYKLHLRAVELVRH